MHCTTLQTTTATTTIQLQSTTTTTPYTTLDHLGYATRCHTALHHTPPHYTERHYATLHYATLHYATLHYATLQQLQLHPHCTTLNASNYITLHNAALITVATYYSYNYNYASLHYARLHFSTLHYTTLMTPPQLQRQLQYTHYTSPQLQYNSTAPLQLQLQLHYTTQPPEAVGEVADQVTPATLKPLQKHNSNHLSVHICHL